MSGSEFTRYVILLAPADAPLTEERVRAHVAHLKRLDEAGQLVLCGPFREGKGGMVILQACTPEEARAIAEADPFVREGARTYELRTWDLSCAENHHMGMG